MKENVSGCFFLNTVYIFIYSDFHFQGFWSSDATHSTSQYEIGQATFGSIAVT